MQYKFAPYHEYQVNNGTTNQINKIFSNNLTNCDTIQYKPQVNNGVTNQINELYSNNLTNCDTFQYSELQDNETLNNYDEENNAEYWLY